MAGKMPEESKNEPMNTQENVVVQKDEDENDDIFELMKAMAVAALIALTIRSFAFEPFNIPSGSMLPSLLVGDYLFVEKYSYGYSRYSFPLDLISFKGRIMEKQPQRGDVAVFRQPKKTHIDYIKRVIGLPGDEIQMKEGLLYINGTPVLRDFQDAEEIKEDGTFNLYTRYVETLPDGAKHYTYELSDFERYDDTEIYKVPQGFYFVMGDNRDSSLDSRAQDQVGFVPAENLIGRASFIFFSTEGTGKKCDREGALAALKSIGCKLVEWPKAIRYGRLFKRVHAL